MNARLFSLAAVSLLVLAACSSYVTIPTPRPRLADASSNAGATTQKPAVEALVPVAGYQAPICAASATCAALDAVQIPLSCVKKVPYTNVLVPVGSTFEVLDESGSFVCLDTGVVVNGKEVITCHGTQLYSFQLRLSNPACAGTDLQTGTGQCDVGYGYHVTQKCCAPVSVGSEGSTVVTVNLGACPGPNP